MNETDAKENLQIAFIFSNRENSGDGVKTAGMNKPSVCRDENSLSQKWIQGMDLGVKWFPFLGAPQIGWVQAFKNVQKLFISHNLKTLLCSVLTHCLKKEELESSLVYSNRG